MNLAFHVAMREEQLRNAGTNDAPSTARRRFGNLTRLRDDIREDWTFAALERFRADVRFAARLLAKNAGFTSVVVLTLAIGIGVNNAMFTLGSAMMGRSLPFDNPDRFVLVSSRDAIRNRDMSWLDYQDWQAATSTFVGIGAFTETTMNVADEQWAPERFVGAFISANAFRLIGEQPIIGRDFAPRDDQPGSSAVVILGHTIWMNRYQSDPAIIGKTVRVNSAPAVVIGVMPAEFRFPSIADLWLPLASMPGITSQPRDMRELRAFGLLADGATLVQARTELDSIAARLSREYPGTNRDIRSNVEPFITLAIGPPLKVILSAMMGMVSFVLLIACANVANLLLSRSANRTREIAVRLSLGATRGRIVRQLLVESILLAAFAGVLGLGLSMLGTRLFDLAVANYDKPYWMRFTVDGIVLAYLAAICLGTAILFGVAPALHASKANVNEVLKGGARTATSGARARRWRSVLVAAEIAVSLVVLAGAGFMIRDFLEHYRLDHAIDSGPIVTMRFELPRKKYPTPELRIRLLQQLEEKLGAIPGISSATIVSAFPAGGGFNRQLSIDGRDVAEDARPVVSVVAIGARYFDTIGLGLIRGRAFTNLDGTAGQENVIVNQRFADLFLQNEGDPSGRRIRLNNPRDREGTTPWLTVVGVSPVVRQAWSGMPDPVVYIPYRNDPGAAIGVMVRAPSGLGTISAVVREEVRRLDADLPVFKILTMDEVLSETRWPQRIFSTMFAIFACIALILSSVGLYAVTAYAVTERTHELAIRMAIGAQAFDVLWLLFQRTTVQLGIGLVFGLVGAIPLAAILETPYDPITLVSIVLLLVVISALASFLPAMRATRLDPVVALRRD